MDGFIDGVTWRLTCPAKRYRSLPSSGLLTKLSHNLIVAWFSCLLKTSRDSLLHKALMPPSFMVRLPALWVLVVIYYSLKPIDTDTIVGILSPMSVCVISVAAWPVPFWNSEPELGAFLQRKVWFPHSKIATHEEPGGPTRSYEDHKNVKNAFSYFAEGRFLDTCPFQNHCAGDRDL